MPPTTATESTACTFRLFRCRRSVSYCAQVADKASMTGCVASGWRPAISRAVQAAAASVRREIASQQGTRRKTCNKASQTCKALHDVDEGVGGAVLEFCDVKAAVDPILHQLTERFALT